MKKFLITKIDKKDNMWIRIEDKTIYIEKEMIYDMANGLSDIVTLDNYSFDNIEKMIEDYGDQYIILFHIFFLWKKILKINKYNIDKLLKEYQKGCRGNIYLCRCYTEILNYKSTTDICIETLEML